MNANVYTKDGAAKTTVTLPESVFGVAWNADLVHQVVVAMQGNARAATAHAKDRGERRGGGKKPWRQKGTGRARHGSRRSPIWIGGGVTHGPLAEKNYIVKVNRKARLKALATTLSKKHADGEVLFLDQLSFTEPKTKDAHALLTALATGATAEKLTKKDRNAALIVLTERSEATEKSFRNFGNVAVKQVKDLNPVDVLSYSYIVFAQAEDAVGQLRTRIEQTPVAA